MPKRYLPELKTQIIYSCKSGLSVLAVSQKHRISKSTIYRWLKETPPKANQITPDYNTLLRQHTRCDHILQIIRLSGIIDNVPLRKRLEILARLHEQFDQYSVHELCEALNVSRGTFYNHIFRKADRTKYLQEQQALMLQVQ